MSRSQVVTLVKLRIYSSPLANFKPLLAAVIDLTYTFHIPINVYDIFKVDQCLGQVSLIRSHFK